MMQTFSANTVLASSKSAFNVKLTAQKPVAARMARFVVRAEAEAAPAEEKVWSPPTLDASMPSPIFGGSTGA